MAVYKKLALIQSKVNGLKKDTKAYNYDYVDGNKVLSAVRPMMKELNLLLMPEVTDIKTETINYGSYDRVAKATVTKTEVLATVTMRMSWVDAEDGEVVSQMWGATGLNGFDKGFGSALTYGERYYLLKLFHIPTDKDDVDAINTERDKDLEAYYQAQATASKPAVNYHPVDEKMYWQFIEAEANGKLCKSGKSCYNAWCEMTSPDAEALEKWQHDLENYKAAHNINN